MGKHRALVGLGLVLLIVGLPLYGQPDPWTRSRALVAIHAGTIFFAVGLATWSIVDVLRSRTN